MLSVLASMSGCLGPRALLATRQEYNEVLHRTANEQLLLNLVRLRYRDPPSFLELSSLSTQFSFDHSASIDGTLFDAGRAPSILGAAGAVDFSERPTATYAPLQGPEFVKRLVSPLTLETIILIARSGWSIDRVLRMTAQELNGIENARTASGPIPEVAPQDYAEFQSIVRTLRRLQLEDEIEFGFETHPDPLSESLPAELINGEDIVAAAREGWTFQNQTLHAEIDPHRIDSDSDIPWAEVESEYIAKLAADIAARGLVKPLHVRWDSNREKFLVVEGHRRWAAIQQAIKDGLSHHDLLAVPCEVIQDGELVLSGTEESLIIRYGSEQQEALAPLAGPRKFRGGLYELPLTLEPRSLLGTMYYLSHAIDVPEEHAAEGTGLVHDVRVG